MSKKENIVKKTGEIKMLDIRFVRENPAIVKENLKKKFQEAKLPMVDEVIELDTLNRAAITEASELRASRNPLSKETGIRLGQATALRSLRSLRRNTPPAFTSSCSRYRT